MKALHSYRRVRGIKVGMFAGIIMGLSVFGHFVPMAKAANDITPTPTPAHGAALKPHVGLLVGAVNPNGPARTTVNYGADVGIQPYIPFGVGLQFNRFATGDSSDPLSDELTRNSLLAKATYNFGGDICILQSSYVGMKAGAVFDEQKNNDTTRFGFGPMIGFDHPVHPNLTLGLEAGYLAVIGHDTPDSTSLNAAVKYWF